MRHKLWSSLRRLSAHEPKDEGLEQIVDIVNQNILLRCMVWLMGFAILALSCCLLVLPGRQQAKANSEVRYADETSTGTAKSDVGVPPPDSKAQRPKKTPAKRPAPEVFEPEAPTAETPKPSVPGLWEFLDQAQHDATRELLDKTFELEGVKLVFHEVTRAGLLHFELVNEGQKAIFLPRIETDRPGSQVYLERRVLEPEAVAQGIIVFSDIAKCRRLELTFGAANLEPFKVKLEMPKWD